MESDRWVDHTQGGRQIVFGDRCVGHVDTGFGIAEENVKIESWIRIDFVDIDHDIASTDAGQCFQCSTNIVRSQRLAGDHHTWSRRSGCNRNEGRDFRAIGKAETASNGSVGIALSKLQRIVFGPLQLHLLSRRPIAIGVVQIMVGTKYTGWVPPQVSHQGSHDELLSGTDVGFINKVVGIWIEVCPKGTVVVECVEFVFDLR